MSAVIDEPTIPPALRRPLAAVWISLGLHGAVIALVHVAPPPASMSGTPVIEARLVPAHTAAAESPAVAAVPAPEPAPDPAPATLAPVPAVDAVPVIPSAASPAPNPVSVPAPAAVPAKEASPPAPAPTSTVAPTTDPVRPSSPATITSAVDLTYYSARDLDVQPRALREIVPAYPEQADRQELSGKVRLRLRLEADGRVSDVEVVSADPVGHFEESALAAFRKARFAPAQKAGRPVRAQVVIEVVYDWDGQR